MKVGTITPAMITVACSHERLERVVRQHTELKRSGKWQVGRCPFPDHHDRRPSFGIRDGRFQCFVPSCGKRGDAIDFVRLLDGVGFVEAVDRLLGPSTTTTTTTAATITTRAKAGSTKSRKSEDDEGPIVRAVCIFYDAGPLRNTPGWLHLIRRGIDVNELPESISDVLRWHPRCPWGNGTYGCMVALFTDAVTGEPRAIHRTAIRPDGLKIDRAYLGPKAGCVIRLWPDDVVTAGLALGEGIETVLAAATRIVHHGTLLRPAWAAGDTGNLSKFPMLAGIEALTILVDHDANGAGEIAAKKCTDRWTAAGREVHWLLPRAVDADFNEIIGSAS